MWVPHRESEYLTMALRSTGEYRAAAGRVAITGLGNQTFLNGDVIRMTVKAAGDVHFEVQRESQGPEFRELPQCPFKCAGTAFFPYVALAARAKVEILPNRS